MTVVFLMILIAAVIGSAGMVAVFAWIFQRLGRLETGSSPDLHRLLAENDELRDQVEKMRSELRALDERVDFTEKLIEGAGQDAPRKLPEP